MKTSPRPPLGDTAPDVAKAESVTGEPSRPLSPRSTPEIIQQAHASLERWRGWTLVASVLARHPEIDLYLAGGALRNVAIGEGSPPVKDFDFFLDERHLETVAAELGRHGRIERTLFGLPRWFPPGAAEPYCDLIAYQRFTAGVVLCETMLDVLQVFDFTANALALDLRRDHFHDPLDGRSDIRSRTLRAVRLDYPHRPLVPGHDLTLTAVLWLRLVHYAAKLGFEIEPVTQAWLRDHAVALRQRACYEKVLQRLHPRFDEVLDRHGLA